MKKLSSFGAENKHLAKRSGFFQILGCIALYASAGQLAQAQTQIWADSGTAWQASANWTPNGTPTATSLTEFDSTVNNQPTTGSTAASTGGIWVTSGVASNVTIGGTSTLTIAGNLGAANGPGGLANTAILLDDSGNHSLTITPTISLSNSTNIMVSNNGTLTLGTVNGASSTYTNSSGGEIAMTAVTTVTSTFTNGGTGTISIGTLSGTNQTFNLNGAGVVSVATWTGGGTGDVINGSNSSAVFNLGSESGVATLTDNSAGTVNITGTIATLGTAGFQINGGSTGIVNITGAGSVTSTKGIGQNSGTLNLASANALTGALTITPTGGTAAVILGSSTAVGAINVGPASGNTANPITTSISSSTNLTGANSVGSSIAVNGEGGFDLTFGGSNEVGAAHDLTFNGGNFTNLDSGTVTIGSGSNITFSGGTFTMMTRNNAVAHNFVVNGGGNITINDVVTTTGQSVGVGASDKLTYGGTGSLTLSNANTYTGPTSITNGTMNVINGSGSATGSGTVTVGGIATAGTASTLGGTGIISGLVTTSSANSNVGHIAPGINTAGNFGGTGTLSLGGGLSLGAGTALDFDLSGSLASGSNDLISMSGGTLTFGGTAGSKIVLNIDATAPLLTGAGNAYTLISNTSGSSTGFVAGDFTLNITGDSTSDTATFENIGNGLEVFFTASVGESTNYYFTGATSNDFTLAGNYTDAISGGNVHSTGLSSTSDVFIAANSPGNLPPTIGTNTVTIDSLTFNSNASGSSLEGSGTVTLASSGTALADTAVGGTTETVDANVGLGASQTWAVTNSTNTLAVTGTISGAHALTLSGPGAFNFSNGGNNYSGGTTVNSTTKLFITNTSGTTTLGTGTLTVQQGATFGGSGNASGLAAFNIGSGGTGTTTLIVGSGGSNTTSSLTLRANGASTIANTNLTFNLNTAGGGNQLNVGATLLQFTGGDTLTLNLVGTNVIAANTPYILVAGTGGNGEGTLAGSQYAGGALGTNGTINGNLVLTGLSLSFGGSQPPSWYANSYVFLVNSGGVDDIEVEVVPEPGTWAMMFGGLAVLFFWQRRKSKQD